MPATNSTFSALNRVNKNYLSSTMTQHDITHTHKQYS